MIRPLITAIIEYLLAFLVFKYGKLHKNTMALIIFLLATYQLGEVIIFMTNGGEIGFKIAYVATTLLPPLGILLTQKILKKNFGYLLFQLISLGFAAYILVIPQVALNFELGPYCIRVFDYEALLAQYYFLYYQGTLMLTMLIIIIAIFRVKLDKDRAVLQSILIAYLSFDDLAILIAQMYPEFWPSSASLMCALALIAAFIFTRVSLAENFNSLLKAGKKQLRWGESLFS